MTISRLFFLNIWIGVCALSMLAQTRLLLDMSLSPGWLDGFVLGGVVFAYNFTHHDRPRKTMAWLAGLLGGVCFLLSLRASAFGQPSALAVDWQVAALFPAALWLSYYGLQKPGKGGLRGMPVVKPFVVAVAWGWVTVMLPVPPEEWGRAAGILLGRSAFIFALALAYDLVDLEYDRRHGLSTLAGKLGFEKTFYLIFSALLLAAFFSCANVIFRIYGLNVALGLLFSLAFSAWWLRHLFRKTGWSNWQKMLIDATMLWQFLMVWGAKGIP